MAPARGWAHVRKPRGSTRASGHDRYDRRRALAHLRELSWPRRRRQSHQVSAARRTESRLHHQAIERLSGRPSPERRRSDAGSRDRIDAKPTADALPTWFAQQTAPWPELTVEPPSDLARARQLATMGADGIPACVSCHSAAAPALAGSNTVAPRLVRPTRLLYRQAAHRFSRRRPRQRSRTR